MSLVGTAPVSVVLPSYCSCFTIARALSSIENQTLIPAEVILVDDASDDDTLEVIQGLLLKYGNWIRLVRLPKNVGAAEARNIGWSIATQPFIAFLDSDDAWHPRKIEIQYGFMAAHPEVLLCAHDHLLLMGNDHALNWKIETFDVSLVSKTKLISSNQFITPSVMIKSNLTCRFNSEQRYMEDHRLWVDIAHKKGKLIKLDVPLACIYKFSFGVSGLSSKIWKMECGDLANIKYFYNAGYVNLPSYILLTIYSIIKFLRRLFIFYFWLIWKT